MAKALPICYLNGKFLPIEEARISPLDRGFLYADSLYEVVPCYAKKPFFLSLHLARLSNGLLRLKMDHLVDIDQITALLIDLIERNDAQDQALYLQVTRGDSDGRDHPFPEQSQATVFAMAMAMPEISEKQRLQGVSAITAADSRWTHCDIKSTALIANVLHKQEAAARGASETILVKNHHVTEGSVSSVFVVQQQKVITPALSPEVLPGITRAVVIELMEELNIPYELDEISESTLLQADEIWLASSTKELSAVTHLNGHEIGDGKAGPIWSQCHQAYQALKASL